ncbi:MAG: hypothetical protein EOO44_12180 [Flavobacterium sp.]|nr:MAG: hypothetical protein EOO44_12180 [Flavobacterium sp.]
MESSDGNIQYLFNLLKKNLAIYLTPMIESAFKNEVPSYKLHHYAYHFKLEGNEVKFPFQFIYIVHTKGFVNTKTFYRFYDGQRQELTSSNTYDLNSEKIDAIYIYNHFYKKIHALTR